MTRAELVEKAARAIQHTGSASEWDQLPVFVQQQYRADARAAADSLLPQITTEAELLALPLGSIVVSHNGYPFARAFDDFMSVGGEYAGSAASVVAQFAPLTVAWQPGDVAA